MFARFRITMEFTLVAHVVNDRVDNIRFSIILSIFVLKIIFIHTAVNAYLLMLFLFRFLTVGILLFFFIVAGDDVVHVILLTC